MNPAFRQHFLDGLDTFDIEKFKVENSEPVYGYDDLFEFGSLDLSGGLRAVPSDMFQPLVFPEKGLEPSQSILNVAVA